MNTDMLTNRLLVGLLELEQAGDLVITNPRPATLAEKLCAQILHDWTSQFYQEPPDELVIEDSLKSSCMHLVADFNMPPNDASSVMAQFYRNLAADRTTNELANLFAHQGSVEIALGAYFCVFLNGGTYYNQEYLDWRKEFHARKPST